ncbi:hypothetical protein N9003_00975 [bacterium]|nr:hypothetical protein [bacterium]
MDEQTRMAFALGGSIDLDTVPDNTQGIDPVSGNEVPIGSTAEEVRDDIPAQLSEGEYVVPADVVRYYGVRFFEQLRAKAKFGFQDMAENGRIGGEPTDEPDMEMMFDVSELEVEDDGKPMKMDEGGYALSPGDEGYDEMGALGLGSSGITSGYESTGSAPTVEVRTYVNEAGHSIYITFINGSPQTSIPPGYTLQAEVVEEAPASEAQPEPQVVTSGGSSSRPMAAPDPVNYKELTTEEIANMLEDQSSAKSTAIAFGAGAINPLLGLFVKGAMMHSARSLEKEIERRIASEEYAGDKGVLEDMLKASKDGKPGLIKKIYGAVVKAFVPETDEEAVALQKAIAMEAGEVYDFEGNITGDAISAGDPAVTGMDIEKTKSPVEVVENTIAPTTGKVSTYRDPITRELAQFESYGQVTRNGVYAGDGFEWYETDIKGRDGAPVLGRRYTGEGEDNNLGQDTIIATELGYGNIEDRSTFIKIAEVSMEEGSQFASNPGSANDGDWVDFITTGSFGASDSFAAMKAKEAGEKNEYSPTLTYGDIIEQVKKPEVKVEAPEVKITEPEVKIEKPKVKEQDAEAQEILDLIKSKEPTIKENPAGEVFSPEDATLLPYATPSATDTNKIRTTLLDDRYGESITPEQSKVFREKRKEREAAAAEAAAAAKRGRDQYIDSMNSTYEVYKKAKKRGASSSELKTIDSEGKKASSKMAKYKSSGIRPTGFKEGGLASKKKNNKKKK